MFFGMRHSIHKLSKNPGIDIDGRQVERINSFKLLGVYVGEILTWKSHIENISKKVAEDSDPMCQKTSSSLYITL